MTISLSLDKHRQARVWIDELPDAVFDPHEFVERLVPAAGSSPAQARTQAIELFVPVGPFAMYGLLGIEFVPDASESLRVRVGVTVESGRLFNDTLAPRADTVHVGMPREYVDSVLHGLIEGLAGKAPSGALVVRCAAHGMVGSNRAIFTRIGLLHAALLDLDHSLVSADAVTRLLTFSAV